MGIFRGLITLAIGLATFFKMPPSPTQTKAWFRPKGWFTEREEVIAVNRVLRDDPTKVCPITLHQTLNLTTSFFQGDMHNREALSLRRLFQALCDYDLWPLYIM